MALPTLIIVSGPPGSGKTTLAHALAQGVPCPAICRDEIKEGMVHTVGDFQPAPGDALTRRTFEVFFDVLRILVSTGVTVVAEAAFQDTLWRRGLEPLSELVELSIVHCTVDTAVALERIKGRAATNATARAAHADGDLLKALDGSHWSPGAFEHLSIPAPSIEVDTTDGYNPDLAAILAFIDRR